MNFSNAQRVLATIRAGDDVELIRSTNRSKVQAMANGVPPLSEEDAKRMGVQVNVNFMEFPRILTRARSQLDSAFTGNKDFFTVKIAMAPIDYRLDWESKISTEINRILNDSLEYLEVHRNRWSSVIMHGVGPMTWRDSEKWLPQFVAMGDLRIPTDTTIDFRNLGWYAQRVNYTVTELVNEVFNDRPNNHWNKDQIKSILNGYKNINFTDARNNYSWNTDAEKLVEEIKQSGGYFSGDAIPTIPLYHFYFQDSDPDNPKIQKWYMRVVAEASGVRGGDTAGFLWESDEPIANSWKELLHCQFGDLSFEPPFKYHSVRGLGFILLDASFYYNLAQCRLLQHVMDNFNIWLRSNDNSEKARNAIQQFSNLGVISQGLSIVPINERHQIDAGVLEFAMADVKRTQAEASASYTQNTDTGTQKETTAFETRVKLEQVNAMMGSILGLAFKYEGYAYREICRRFCIKNSSDPDVMKFRVKMRSAGIPDQFLDVKLWDVEPVIPIGRGNQTMAQAIIQQMMEVYPMLPPQGQQKVIHRYIQVITDSATADDLVPLDVKEPSEAARESIGLFAGLMDGIPQKPRGTYLIDQIDQLKGMLGYKTHMIEQRDNMSTAEEAIGLNTVLEHIGQLVQMLAQDQKQKERVKGYSDELAKLGNEIKGINQRGQQAREAQAKQQQDAAGAADMAKAQSDIQSKQALTQNKLQTSQATTAQKMQHKEEDERRKQMAFDQEQQRKSAQTISDIELQKIQTAADIENKRKVAEASAAAKPTTTEK